MSDNPGSLDGGHRAILFDLDGTLVDTAPDMAGVLARMLEQHGRPALDYDLVRNNVSNGAVGLLKLGFPEAQGEDLSALRAEYLEYYEEALCIESTVFAPLNELLGLIERHGRSWGIVTNKPHRMTIPLLEQLGIRKSAACVVSGDTLPQNKPHPAPLLHAAELANISPSRTIYVGDAARDIEAGNAAGMSTVAVGYGYITDDDNPRSWGADAFAADTMVLMQLLLTAVDIDNE